MLFALRPAACRCPFPALVHCLSNVGQATNDNFAHTPALVLAVQELLQQLGGVGVIGEAQAEVIMDRYRNKDAVVFAALDVYKNESDMSELVDTLKRLT